MLCQAVSRGDRVPPQARRSAPANASGLGVTGVVYRTPIAVQRATIHPYRGIGAPQCGTVCGHCCTIPRPAVAPELVLGVAQCHVVAMESLAIVVERAPVLLHL